MFPPLSSFFISVLDMEEQIFCSSEEAKLMFLTFLFPLSLRMADRLSFFVVEADVRVYSLSSQSLALSSSSLYFLVV